MLSFDLLIPWITLALTIFPLLWVQRWLHRHLFGMGYLISRDKGPATLLYYSFLMPGVFLHEFSHYMVAGMFAIRPKRFAFFPEAQEDGSLEMGFVQLEDVKNPIFGAIIGIAPLITGTAAVVLISNKMLDLPFFFSVLRSADFQLIATAFHQLTSKPDFWLWLYVLFAVSNAMMPNKEDRRGWWIVFIVPGAVLLFLIAIGMQKWVAAWLAGPIADALYSVSAVFSTVLAIDLVAMALVWTIEHMLERVTGHKVQYAPALGAGNAAAMLGSGVGPKSVFDLRLPIPPAPGKVVKPPARLPAGGERRALGSGDPDNRPARPVGTQTPAPAALSRPTFNPAPKPGSAAPAASGTGSSAPSGTPAPGTSAPGNQPARPGAAPLSAPGGARPGGAFGSSGSSTSGTPGGSGSSSGSGNQPARPGGAFGSSGSSSSGTPGGSGSSSGSGNQPARPGGAFGSSGSSSSGTPGSSGGSGNQPARPGGAPGGSGSSSSSSNQPARPGGPISGPPALRPNQPATPARPGPVSPVPKPGGTPSPAPKPGGAFGQRPRFGSRTDDDYIEGEVVDDDDEEELEYVDDDDVEVPDDDIEDEDELDDDDEVDDQDDE